MSLSAVWQNKTKQKLFTINTRNNTMKILIVEDKIPNIHAVRAEIEKHMGGGHELMFARTAKGLRMCIQNILDRKYDLVLTDMYLAVGLDDSYGPTNLHPHSLTPAGLVAVVAALTADVPCILCTDANGHHDILGMLLESQDCHVKGDKLFANFTRPNMTNGKNWGLEYLTQHDEKWMRFLKPNSSTAS